MELAKVTKRTNIRNRNLSYAEITLGVAQFEKCLLPLYQLGQGTTQEIASRLNVPINEVTGRFNECLKKGLVHINPAKPTVKNTNSGKNNTNYILSGTGKNFVINQFSVTN